MNGRFLYSITRLIVVSGVVALCGNSSAQPAIKILSPGKWSGFPGLVQGVAVAGSYAYVAGGPLGLEIVDVSDPAKCVKAGGYSNDPEVGEMTYGVAVSGNFAYSASWVAGFQVIDVSDPANCRRVTGFGSKMVAVALAGNVACVAGWDDGLKVFDVSDPPNCRLVSNVALSDTAWDVAVAGNYVYVAAGNAGLQIIDVSNPTNCFRVGAYLAVTGRVHRVAVSGNQAFMAVGQTLDTKPELQVINVSDPTNCFRVASYEFQDGIGGIAVSGNYVFVTGNLTDGLRGVGMSLVVIDNGFLTNYLHASRYPIQRPGRVTVAADRIYVADGSDLLVLPTVANFQTTLRVDAQPNSPFTIEGTSNLANGDSWSTLITTNVSSMPFDFVDFDVKSVNGSQKFYRVRQ